MPDKSTIKKAKEDKAEGKSASTQAGEFVHDEIEKIRKGEHGARSTKQAIAIGLSEARRAGVKLSTPKNASKSLKKKVKQDEERSKSKKPVSRKRSRARIKALKKEPTSTVSKKALSKQAKSVAKKRTASDRSKAAKKASRTKGPKERSTAAKKAARTRAKSSK
jgi:uncharacterized protein DUF6496